MITAVFSLITQLVSYKACPPFKIDRTNDKHAGQVYLHAANWLCMMCAVAPIRRSLMRQRHYRLNRGLRDERRADSRLRFVEETASKRH